MMPSAQVDCALLSKKTVDLATVLKKVLLDAVRHECDLRKRFEHLQ